jgi:hypothetical protein
MAPLLKEVLGILADDGLLFNCEVAAAVAVEVYESLDQADLEKCNWWNTIPTQVSERISRLIDDYGLPVTEEEVVTALYAVVGVEVNSRMKDSVVTASSG